MASKLFYDPDVALLAANALLERDCADEAEKLLDDAPTRWPHHEGILSVWAGLPMHREDWADAVGRCSLLMQRFPASPEFVAMKAECLIIAGRLDEASDALQRAKAAFPNDARCSAVRVERDRVAGLAAAVNARLAAIPSA